MYQPIRYHKFDDGTFGYKYCRNCHKKKSIKKWGYCFCSHGCMEKWFDKNRLIFLAMEDYKDRMFQKGFDVQKIFSLAEAASILTPIIMNRLHSSIKKRVVDVIESYMANDSIQTKLKYEIDKDILETRP